MSKEAQRRAVLAALCAASLAACTATRFATNQDDPATPTAPTSPLPQVAAALAPGFDPLQAEGSPPPSSTDTPAAGHDHAAAASEEPQTFTCPMHPEIVRGESGNCPICGMKLVPAKPKAPDTDTK